MDNRNFVLTESKKTSKILAKGTYKGYHTNSPSSNEMVVHKGSNLVKNNRLRKSNCIAKREYVEQNFTEDKGNYLVLTHDVTFTSPSLAAAVMLGKEANGNEQWRNDKDERIKDLFPSARKKQTKK